MFEKLSLWLASLVFTLLSVIAGFTFKDLYRRLRSVETFRDEFKNEVSLKIQKMDLTLEHTGKMLDSLTQEVRLLTKIVVLSRSARRSSDDPQSNHCHDDCLEELIKQG